MIVWSGWGICVVLIAAAGLLLGVGLGQALIDNFGLAQGPAEAAGVGAGGIAAAVANFFFVRWREGGEGRVFIDEATGQRIDVRPSAGSFFFIPSRYWTWIILAIFAFGAYSEFTRAGTPAY